MFERLYQKQALREQFLDAEGKLREKAGETYQRHIEQFQELLLVFIQLTCEQQTPELW